MKQSSALNLTERQYRFVEEFQRDFNATRAAIRAGYSARTAHAMGHKNMRNPKIQRALNAMHRHEILANPRMLHALGIVRSPRFAEIEEILTESFKDQPAAWAPYTS